MSAKQSKSHRRLAREVADPPDAVPILNHQSFSLSYTKSILPPAAELEKLEVIYPGIAKRILDNWDNQGKHRQELERFVIAGDSRRADIGQWLAFALGVIALVGGFVLIAIGKDGAGIATVIGSVATLLTAFFGGALLRKMERQKKTQVLNAKARKR
jgi:drug/metabolite transporter (DMT)-like permease